MNKSFFQFFLAGFVTLLLLNACRKDNFYTGSDLDIRVSVDTIRFDTVFTEVGTTTKLVKLYNDLDQSILIDEIRLVDQSDFFRLNIDGTPSNQLENVEIAGNDSLYVFVEATIDPNLPLSISPYIIEDQIIIEAGEKQKPVFLEAWGQNANYVPSRFSSSQLNYYSCDLGTWVWDDPKPYVLYGSLLIDSCQLVWPAGTEVYVHGGIAINDLGIYNDGLLYFLSNGSLVSQGTVDQPVTVRTDRLEEEWAQDGGQWSGIIFSPGSRNNELSHTQISNSIVGIRVDSMANAKLESCEISYTSGSAIIGRHADIDAQNCLFHNNGLNGLQFVFGGNYNFDNCTISNFDNQAQALQATNFFCTDPLCQGPIYVNRMDCKFQNCIFIGNDEDEISLADATVDIFTDFSYSFKNCIVQVDELLDPESFPNFFDNCENCLNNVETDSLFIAIEEADFHLDTMSVAIDKGIFIPSILNDIEGNPRESNAFDIGCYEFQK